MTAVEQKYLRTMTQALRIATAIAKAEEQLEFCLDVGYDAAATQLAFDIEMMEYFLQVTLYLGSMVYSEVIYERYMKGEIKIHAIY